MKIDQFYDKARQFIAEGKPHEVVRLLTPFASGKNVDSEILFLLGFAQMMSLDYKLAVQSFDRSIASSPGRIEVLKALGEACSLDSQYARAAESYALALEINDRDIQAWDGLGVNSVLAGDIEKSLEIYDLLLARGAKAAAYNVGLIVFEQIDQDRYHELLLRAASEFPEITVFQSKHAMGLCYFNGTIDAELKQAHENYVASLMPNLSKLYRTNVSDVSPDPLRVGILTSDFRYCAVNNFMLPLVRALASCGVELYFYPTQKQEDAATIEYKKYGTWKPRNSPVYQKVAESIATDRLNILLEINALTNLSVPEISAFRPAPVQIHAIGYPAKTYWPWIDARLTDDASESNPKQDDLGEENLALKRCFLCYDTKREFPELSSRKPDYSQIRFASFNNPQKLSPQLLSSFEQILIQVPGSTLMFKHVNLATVYQRKNISDYFTRCGLSDRIIFTDSGDLHDRKEHLLAYNDIDIALDSSPYNGTTTTCDSLSMGVPVVCALGDNHRSRVSYSILKSAGMEEFCAPSASEFVEHVKNIAKSFPSKQEVRRRFFESELTNEDHYGEHLVRAFEEIWQRKVLNSN